MKDGEVILVLYVDDILIFWPETRETIDRLICQLQQRLEIVDLCVVSHLLGLGISRDAETGLIKLSQEAFARGVVERFSIADARVPT